MFLFCFDTLSLQNFSKSLYFYYRARETLSMTIMKFTLKKRLKSKLKIYTVVVVVGEGGGGG